MCQTISNSVLNAIEIYEEQRIVHEKEEKWEISDWFLGKKLLSIILHEQ